MLSIAYIIVFGFLGNSLFNWFKLPGLLGMILAGILIGPFGLDLLDEPLMIISSDLRTIALIIILLRAGLGLHRTTLKKIGKRAALLSVIPGILEGTSIIFMAMIFLNMSFVEAGMLGFILAAVSPAVIVPSMLLLMKRHIGVKKHIPALVLSAASIDDVIAITIFSSFLSVYVSANINIAYQVISIPISILLGILLGIGIGFLLMLLFKKYHMRDSQKITLLIAVSILMVGFSNLVSDQIHIAALLGVMTIGIVITEMKNTLGTRLAIKFEKVWVLAEVFLFVLVGAAVDVEAGLSIGVIGLVIIIGGLFMRTVGVFIALIGKTYLLKEKLFIAIAYTPKATVQAAIGALPLSVGVASGNTILAFAVLSILATAPLGAIGISKTAKSLLKEAS
ncbi:MAG: cation:proton antiporter [Bacillota bacterium]